MYVFVYFHGLHGYFQPHLHNFDAHEYNTFLNRFITALANVLLRFIFLISDELYIFIVQFLLPRESINCTAALLI